MFEAGGWLVAARLVVWFMPFRRLAKGLGKKMAESSTTETEVQRSAAILVSWAVQGLGQRLPWMSQCLVQALAATWMLQRRHIPSTFYFGLAKDPSKQLKAHAWVRSGTLVLTGAQVRDQFKVVATFATPALDVESERCHISIDSLKSKDSKR